MKLKIEYVTDHGELKDERIVLRAVEDVNVGEFMIADTTYQGSDSVSNKLRHTFWVPDKDVDKGDLVVIYTKSGTDSEKENKSGSKTHFFYWGLAKTVWNKNSDAALLIEIRDWAHKSV
ncbi:hypothetical protein KS874_004646 [Vibrio parahaemolyticus]|nr:hypothetical protein [Vibrio parahaemolyticus]